ncbi:MAG: J domain-containing protein [Chlorobi bacterium]|nr:J domain-containing protein [Chlorobiota bacterium]
MGIFERLVRILRAEITDHVGGGSTVELPRDDDELRRIIEELNAKQSPERPRPTGVVEWAYRTLGVTPMATNDDIKAAYRRAISRTHPDRFARAPEQQQREAARRAQEINRAYAILKAVRKF